jgi:hypothetical protein
LCERTAIEEKSCEWNRSNQKEACEGGILEKRGRERETERGRRRQKKGMKQLGKNQVKYRKKEKEGINEGGRYEGKKKVEEVRRGREEREEEK